MAVKDNGTTVKEIIISLDEERVLLDSLAQAAMDQRNTALVLGFLKRRGQLHGNWLLEITGARLIPTEQA